MIGHLATPVSPPPPSLNLLQAPNSTTPSPLIPMPFDPRAIRRWHTMLLPSHTRRCTKLVFVAPHVQGFSNHSTARLQQKCVSVFSHCFNASKNVKLPHSAPPSPPPLLEKKAAHQHKNSAVKKTHTTKLTTHFNRNRTQSRTHKHPHTKTHTSSYHFLLQPATLRPSLSYPPSILPPYVLPPEQLSGPSRPPIPPPLPPSWSTI